MKEDPFIGAIEKYISKWEDNLNGNEKWPPDPIIQDTHGVARTSLQVDEPHTLTGQYTAFGGKQRSWRQSP